MPIESSHAVDCVYCAGKGCEECGGTGQRYTHLIREGDASVRFFRAARGKTIPKGAA